jgi:hypothetical protein
VARGYSGYLDSLLNNTMKNSFQSAMPMHVPFLADYPGLIHEFNGLVPFLAYFPGLID